MSSHSVFPDIEAGLFYELVEFQTHKNVFNTSEEFMSFIFDTVKDDQYASTYLKGRLELTKKKEHKTRLVLYGSTLYWLDTFETEEDLNAEHIQPTFPFFKRLMADVKVEVSRNKFTMV